MEIIGNIYNKFKADYWLTSILLSVVTFVLYLVFIFNVQGVYYDSFTFLSIVAMSTSVGYGYATIRYFFSNIHPILRGLKPFLENQHQTSLNDLEKKVQISWQFYLTITIIVLPFIILDLINILKYKFFNGPTPPLFYFFDQTLWSLLFDVINHIVAYLLPSLVAVVIWMMLKLSFILNELNKIYSINISVLDIHAVERLESLRNLFQSIVIRYFIIVTLFIFSYETSIELIILVISQYITAIPFEIPPVLTMLQHIIPFEIVALSLMILLGVIIFLRTQKTSNYLINKSLKYELNDIYKRYEETFKIFEFNPNIKNDKNKEELENLRLSLDFFEKREMRIKAILHKESNTETIVTFIITTLPSVLTLINEVKKIFNK